jgi:hypothetical protein
MRKKHSGEWKPRGGELVATDLGPEVLEVNSPDQRPIVTPISREAAWLVASRQLDGPISDEVGARLRTLGRQQLAADGIDFEEFRVAYFAANPDRLPDQPAS